MSATLQPTRPTVALDAIRVACLALGVAVLAAILAGWAPVQFSIATVFLFAGPHNWLEFRYFLNRMPARWGPLRGFFLLAIAGALLLTCGFAALPWLGQHHAWRSEAWTTASAVWNSSLVLWIAALLHLRGKEREGRDWSWIWAVAGCVCAALWLIPGMWELALVYLHPLVSLAFLQRVLKRKRPDWLPAYYASIAAIPLLMGALWLRLAHSPDLPGQDGLTLRITQHAGAGILTDVSTHFLVAAHTFLEMLHYGVWVVAIPLLALRGRPWNLDRVPLANRGGWRRGVATALVCGAVLVVGLWASFVANYPVTRDVYFTAAMLHVLAEFPFLIRTL